jgi:NodT family efflux transporter outer membrane factor (OMF) lipoprotein
VQETGNQMGLSTRFVAALALVLLAACSTLGPNYVAPEVAWLDEWQLSSEQLESVRAAQDQVDLRFWWEILQDSTLNQLIGAAKQGSPSLRIAGLRVLESRAALGIAGSTLYPQVQQLSGEVSQTGVRQDGASQTTQYTSSQVAASAAWELDFWGRFRRGIESADAAFFASIANQQNLQVLINAQIAELYFAYRTNEARINIARENAAIQQRSYEIAESLFNSGQSSELDLQQAKTQYLTTMSKIPGLELALTQLRNGLGALLGRAPGDLPELESPDYKLPCIQPARMEEVPAQLMMRRPDIRAAALQVAAQSAQIGIAQADYYPAISLFGSIGWSDSSNAGSQETAAVGPSLRWNIFDWGRIENNIRVQDARLQQLIESYQETVLQAAREIDDAGTAVLKTTETQVIIDESVEAASRALQIANSRYKEGYADFQRVLDAQRALAAQADVQVINQGSHISAVIGLYRSLGGGWINMGIEELVPEEIRTKMEHRSDWGDLLIAPFPEKEPEQILSSET